MSRDMKAEVVEMTAPVNGDVSESPADGRVGTGRDVQDMDRLGKKQVLRVSSLCVVILDVYGAS